MSGLWWFQNRARLLGGLWARRARTPLARANQAAPLALNPKAPLDECDFVVLDLETTGINLETDRVISVGAVRLGGGRILLGRAFSELVNPGPDMPTEAVTVHGITPDMLAAARPVEQVLDDLLEYVGHGIIVAHNAGFDLHFLAEHMLRSHGARPRNLVIDTVRLCKELLLPSDPYGMGRHVGRCRLDALAERFDIATPERHIASGDALVTAMIFQRMLALLRARGQDSLGRLAAVGRLVAV